MLDAAVKGWVGTAVAHYNGSVFLVQAFQSQLNLIPNSYTGSTREIPAAFQGCVLPRPLAECPFR